MRNSKGKYITRGTVITDEVDTTCEAVFLPLLGNGVTDDSRFLNYPVCHLSKVLGKQSHLHVCISYFRHFLFFLHNLNKHKYKNNTNSDLFST